MEAKKWRYCARGGINEIRVRALKRERRRERERGMKREGERNEKLERDLQEKREVYPMTN